MIDSVDLWLSSIVPPPTEALSKFTRKGERLFYRDVSLNYSPTLFCRQTPDKKYYLSIQASLPKVIYGHNVKMLGEFELKDALKVLQKFATSHFGVLFDIQKANVRRIDYCYNFSVGNDLLYSYLYAASQAEPARMKRRVIGKIETVEFANKSRKIYCYDKGREVEYLSKKNKINNDVFDATRGVLRLEARYNTTESIKRLCHQLELPDIQAQTLLNFDIAKSILISAVEALNLHKPVIPFDARLDKLQKAFGFGSQFQRLAGFLYLCQIYGFEKLVEIGVMKRSAYYKQRKEVADAGALVFSNCHRTLPALRVR